MREKNFFLLAFRDELIALKELFFENKLIFAFLLIALTSSLYFIDPIPGKTIRIAIAGQDSGYSLIAQKLKDILAKDGISLEVKSYKSSIESAQALAVSQDGVNAALIQGGVLDPEMAEKIQSVGSVDFEPVWIFYRKGLASKINVLGDLSKLRVGVGPSQSGTWIISKKLFMLNGINIETASNFKADSYENNLADMLSGKLDAIINVNPSIDPVVIRLLHEPAIELLDLVHAAAYDIHLPFVREVSLPAASIDVEKQIPPKDIALLTTTTSLAVSSSMHPGLQVMLLKAVKESQRGTRNLFLKSGDKFPIYLDTSISISQAASDYYDYGVPQVMRFLPFWLGGIIDRIWVYLLALFAIILPITQLNINLRSIRFNLRIESIQRELIEYGREIMSGALSFERQSLLLTRVNILIENESKCRIPAGCESDYLALMDLLTGLRDQLIGANQNVH